MTTLAIVALGPTALIAYTGTVLIFGYAIVVAVFAAGVRTGRVLERAKR